MADNPLFSAGVENVDTSEKTIGKSGSVTNSNTDVLNTIHNLVQNLQAQTTQGTSDQTTAGATTQNNTGASTQDTTGTSTSSTTGVTQNTGTSKTTSDASSINLSKGIAAQALSNSTDTTKTNDLVSNIINQAAIAFAPTKVAATNNVGAYNSTTQRLLADNAAAQATGSAAGAVLNYQTAQQQIAQAASAGLLGATKETTDTGATVTGSNTSAGSTSSTAGTTSGTQTGTQTGTQKGATTGATATAGSTETNATVNTLTNLLSTVFSNSESSTTGSKTSEKAGLSLSIICTELMIQGKLSKRAWKAGMEEFAKYPEAGKQGYYLWAKPCVLHLQQFPNSKRSKFLEKLFVARSHKHYWACSFVWFLSFVMGLYWLSTKKSSLVDFTFLGVSSND